MFVVIEMGGGYSEDPRYVDTIYGPFATEAEAKLWLKQTKRRWGFTVHNMFPAT